MSSFGFERNFGPRGFGLWYGMLCASGERIIVLGPSHTYVHWPLLALDKES